jgi:hypothetical protein
MEQLNAFWAQYHILILALVWPILSGILNVALRKKTAEEWVAYAETNPRAHAMLKLIRAVGFDPVKAIKSFQQLAQGKADASKKTLKEGKP